uniref:DUF4412 domain-containing protein n=1 Tax=candidate division WOR-3 bacterium TaxID=2052148 RepID=A0A7C4TGS2_UNCW3
MPSKKIALFWLLIFYFLYGDVMYEMVTTTEGMMGMGKSESLIRNFIKGKFMRTEVITQHPVLGEIKNISIVRLDKNVIWVLDEGKKEYTELRLSENLADTIEIDTTLPLNIKVEKFNDKKTILKTECEKYVVNMEVKSSEGNATLIQTMWVGKDIPGYDEIVGFNEKFTGAGMGMLQGPMMGIDKESFRQFREKISEIEGFPLETELSLTMEEGFSIKTKSEITKITTVPISDKVFEIPEGYKLKEEK